MDETRRNEKWNPTRDSEPPQAPDRRLRSRLLLEVNNAPVRVGVRGGQLPFGATGSAPTEWGVAAGTGRVLANGRGFLDIGVERLARDGGGLRERLWTIVLGLTLRP